jgi:hypothetical protein
MRRSMTGLIVAGESASAARQQKAVMLVCCRSASRHFRQGSSGRVVGATRGLRHVLTICQVSVAPAQERRRCGRRDWLCAFAATPPLCSISPCSVTTSATYGFKIGSL